MPSAEFEESSSCSSSSSSSTNPDHFAIGLTEQISSIGLFAVTESQCTEDEHDDEDDSKFRNLGLERFLDKSGAETTGYRGRCDKGSVVFKIPGTPCVPAHCRLGIQFGGLKIFLSQIFFQAQIPVSIILELGTDIDLVVTGICVDVISFPISPDHRHFIRGERFKVMLLLGRRSNDGPESCRREQVLCLPGLSAAQSQDYESEGTNELESGKYGFHIFCQDCTRDPDSAGDYVAILGAAWLAYLPE
jgi:hypothetical protein